MSKNNETIADIVAELRSCPKNTLLGGIVSLICNGLADRIEAAAKREEEHAVEHATKHAEAIARDNCRDCIYNPRSKNYEGGNSAAMREALEFAAKQLKNATEDNTFGDDIVYLVGCMRAVASVCRQSLSAPLKNGDIGTEEKKLARWWEFCNKFDDCTGCPCNGHPNCFAKWTQMPYKKGDKK